MKKLLYIILLIVLISCNNKKTFKEIIEAEYVVKKELNESKKGELIKKSKITFYENGQIKTWIRNDTDTSYFDQIDNQEKIEKEDNKTYFYHHDTLTTVLVECGDTIFQFSARNLENPEYHKIFDSEGNIVELYTYPNIIFSGINATRTIYNNGVYDKQGNVLEAIKTVETLGLYRGEYKVISTEQVFFESEIKYY